jgi:hypothetical protein
VISIAAFDLLALNGIDLRALPLSDRKASLRRIVDRSPGCLQIVDDFPNGAQLLEAADTAILLLMNMMSPVACLWGTSPIMACKSVRSQTQTTAAERRDPSVNASRLAG